MKPTVQLVNSGEQSSDARHNGESVFGTGCDNYPPGLPHRQTPQNDTAGLGQGPVYSVPWICVFWSVVFVGVLLALIKEMML